MSVQVKKSLDEELMQATFLVLAPEEVDLQGDIYSAEEVRKACHSYNIHCNKANLLHLMETTTFKIVESYISPVDMIMNDVLIKAGSWMAVAQVYDDDVWESIKLGELCGVSIGARAEVEHLTD